MCTTYFHLLGTVSVWELEDIHTSYQNIPLISRVFESVVYRGYSVVKQNSLFLVFCFVLYVILTLILCLLLGMSLLHLIILHALYTSTPLKSRPTRSPLQRPSCGASVQYLRRSGNSCSNPTHSYCSLVCYCNWTLFFNLLYISTT